MPGPGASQGLGSPSAQLALLRPMLAGARATVEIEPAGRLVRTSSPFLTGRRVTLMDVPIDALFGDEALLQRLQSAGTLEEVKTILQSVPGLKLNMDPEITMEFQ
jgi:hypothetical protein